jgi:cytochrome o ubiquinol oxidase subunit II
MRKHKRKLAQVWVIPLVGLGLAALTYVTWQLIRGNDTILLNPKGVIAQEQLNLMLLATAVLLTIAVPSLFLFYLFAWRYRETNQKPEKPTNEQASKLVVFAIWAIPSTFAVMMALVMWPATHKLDPHKSIEAYAKPMTIQVVAMRWKWLFIYPEQNIATVNYLQIPVDTPIKFELTADEAPMSSFWIPHLGGQLYAMTGHANQLNLMADTLGDYTGRSAEINGEGFAGMKFLTRVSTKQQFDRWVEDTRLNPQVLTAGEYVKLLEPSEDNPAAFYSKTEEGLYDIVLMKYMGSHGDETGHE